MVKEGRTYAREDEPEWEEFGDFVLKLIAEISEQGRTSEGYWLCQCSSVVNIASSKRLHDKLLK